MLKFLCLTTVLCISVSVSQFDCTPISHIGREKPSCNRIAAVLATTLVGSLLGVQQMAKIQNVQWIPNALFIARKLRPTSVAKAAPTKIPLPTAVPLTFVGNNSPRRT
ncbi:Protein of unknown function [Cotesia congregata]|uniref:Uncharacterized protein n=1 Tax=Cotesia congregata TaxID=51543 RepID=A0A8J2MTJ8_COTCN|nr:Protein of unknown function [Cotesia congregata]